MNIGLSRREALAALAATPLAAQTAFPPVDAALVASQDSRLAQALQNQITDPRHPGCGSVAQEDGLYSAGSAAGLLVTFMASYLNSQARLSGDPLLVDRMKLAARFLETAQHASGCIDLLTTNFNSPPDTGFVVHNAASAACLAQRSGRRELVALCEPFLRKAGAAMAVGGVHTPNHRWVICSALAQINEVFPDPLYVRRIDQWLAEGVDLDPDGQFTERSTSIYNAVCDRAFVVLAAKLNRPALLDPVRRNLESMLWLLHADGEVVTEISRRQDKNEHADLRSYWFPLRYLATRDRHAVFAGLAERYAAQASLAALMEYPEMAGPLAASAPPPADFEKHFPALDIVRFRRGPRSASIVGADSVFFTLRHGDAWITHVRMAAAFFGKGQFVPRRVEKAASGYALRQSLEAGYYQPLDPARKVGPGEWGTLRSRRRVTELCRFEQSAEIAETPSGFRVRLAAAGTTGVPVTIEIALRPGTTVEGAEPLAGAAGSRWLLAEGHATLRGASNSIRVGPGLGRHRYIQVRGAEPLLAAPAIFLTAFAPFEHTLEFVCA
jgi:hypothetical protein